MNIYAFAIQKGGTGKTTTAAILSQAAVYRGLKTLAIDLDPQGNLSFALAADVNRPGSYDLLHGAPARDLLQHSPQGMDVIAAARELSAETSGAGSARRLQQAIGPLRALYDIIIIDSPTAAGELQYNALQAATGVIIPTEADTYNNQSIYQTLETIHQIQHSNPELKIAGMVITKNDARSNIVKAFCDQYRSTTAAYNIPLLGVIRYGPAPIKEAAAFQQSIYDTAPKSNQAQDYLKVFDTLQAQEV